MAPRWREARGVLMSRGLGKLEGGGMCRVVSIVGERKKNQGATVVKSEDPITPKQGRMTSNSRLLCEPGRLIKRGSRGQADIGGYGWGVIAGGS